MKTVIIEDEKQSLAHVKKLVTCLPQITLVGEAMNCADAIALISTEKPELLLLDIQLQESNGFELLTSLGEYNFDVIFITAYDQYGIQAVKCSALDYILKPVQLPDLVLAVQKASRRKEHRQTRERIQNLMSMFHLPLQEQRVGFHLLKEIRFIDPSTIIRCEAANNYTHIFLDNGEKLIISKGLGECDAMLMAFHFIRCHQSHLVNSKFIKSLLTNDTISEIQLTVPGPRIPVSRLKKEYVHTRLVTQSVPDIK